MVGMTERKPPGMRFETWIDKQIREARERGEFDNLAGMGKPIPDLHKPFSAEQWAIDRVEKEGGDLSALLPPLVAMRKERSRILRELAGVPSEAVLRATIEEFNARLLTIYRRPIEGPMVAVGVLDEEVTVAAWKALRPIQVPPPSGPLPAPEARRRWWQRRKNS
jgi:hypothetical protein